MRKKNKKDEKKFEKEDVFGEYKYTELEGFLKRNLARTSSSINESRKDSSIQGEKDVQFYMGKKKAFEEVLREIHYLKERWV